jgi:lipoprotein-releasing system permease protein
VVGIFNSGMYEYDSRLVYVSLESAQLLFGLGKAVHGINVKIKDPVLAYQTKKKLLSRLSSPNEVATWMDQNRNLFGALKTEKNVMFILLVMAIAVAAMNIASTLIMMVMEKTKDIGILKSIGAHAGIVLKIFLFQGLIVGGVGTLLGLSLGLSIVFNIDSIQAFVSAVTGFEVFPSDIYYLDKIPADVNPHDIFMICLAALVISVLASLYPAFRASRFNAVEALRYE